MALKQFLYRGKTVEELKKLSMTELEALLPSDSRRKLLKLTDAEKKFLKKVENAKKPIKTHYRDVVIIPMMIGKNIMIHDGKTFQPVIITEDMIGHRLGEFAMTRRRVTHNAPGIGATRSSSSMSVK